MLELLFKISSFVDGALAPHFKAKQDKHTSLYAFYSDQFAHLG